ncbi:hypothetical protein [Candidatus Poriferisodalis sp.]|uniref:hypothetical protein n=1 Tax=Candidatus Poriferisodalis sp. TaxID=3101277 RepID=UPI003B02E742
MSAASYADAMRNRVTRKSLRRIGIVAGFLLIAFRVPQRLIGGTAHLVLLFLVFGIYVALQRDRAAALRETVIVVGGVLLILGGPTWLMGRILGETAGSIAFACTLLLVFGSIYVHRIHRYRHKDCEKNEAA